jgi:hypothetical protein
MRRGTLMLLAVAINVMVLVGLYLVVHQEYHAGLRSFDELGREP